MIMTLEDLLEKDEKDRKFNRRMKRIVIGLFVLAAISTFLTECTMLPI